MAPVSCKTIYNSQQNTTRSNQPISNPGKAIRQPMSGESFKIDERSGTFSTYAEFELHTSESILGINDRLLDSQAALLREISIHILGVYW